MKTLWEAARQLDLEKGKDVAEIELFVNQQSIFSSKSKILKKEEDRKKIKKDSKEETKPRIDV